MPATLPARANPDHLAQVLANLLSNAVRYTPARRHGHRPGGAAPGDVLVSIANTGEGIPPDDLERVFERFYRVEKSRDRARGGAGIGLAIVKQLVEAGGGRVGRRVGRRADPLLVQPPGLSRRRLRQADRDHPDEDARQPDPLDRLEPLAQERDRDDDRDRRPERRGEADQPRLGDARGRTRTT